MFCYIYSDFTPKGNALVEKQRISLVDTHKCGCPWRSRQCDSKLNVLFFESILDSIKLITPSLASIYRIPLQSPAATVRGVKAVAISLEESMKDVSIKHPLVGDCELDRSICSHLDSLKPK